MLLAAIRQRDQEEWPERERHSYTAEVAILDRHLLLAEVNRLAVLAESPGIIEMWATGERTIAAYCDVCKEDLIDQSAISLGELIKVCREHERTHNPGSGQEP